MDSIGDVSSSSFDRALQAHINRHNSRMSDHDRIDEGFSEDINEDSAGETSCAPEPIEIDEPEDALVQAASVRNWLLTQPVELRTEFARVILASLPTPALSAIVKEADARLHFDPATYFPPEIYFHILKYLTPRDLIRSSYVSKAWRVRAMDAAPWRRLFALEGWTSNPRTVRMLESTAQTQVRKFWASAAANGLKQLPQQSHIVLDGQIPKSRLWIKDASFHIPSSLTDATMDVYTHHGVRQRNLEFMQGLNPVEDVTMLDANSNTAVTATNGKLQGVYCPLLDPPRLVNMAQQIPRPNWQYLFTQRYRLEQNWNLGLFKNFRLPKEEYDHEKHRECIYTLQFSSAHVVSGSRDKTIRVWDLEAQRLKLPPLCGHRASVLCLQFDDSPAMDVIVSGGSDSAIIFWKFSTGTQLKQVKKAHTMAVLNLRFDQRYLVTCSKDDTIKVWSMKDLAVSDPDYPSTNKSRDAVYPEYIVDINELASSPGLRHPAPLPKFTLLMTLVGHGAAVNALQLLGDEIVSASGDRKIMLWHIPSGTLKKTFSGHAKGIACVQYDGRRIISGSSDETVRIFDVESSAEISLLTGHRDLVRTIQADFGDVPGEELREEAEARAHSELMLNNKRRRLFGELAPATKDEQFIIGAKLPPGGGGNKWSKIVSGSYDETVIIWRQDKKGRWMIMKELRQEDAMRATTTARPLTVPRVPMIPPTTAPRPTAPNGVSSTSQQATHPTRPSSSLPSQTPTPSQLRDAQRQAALLTAQGWLGTRRLSNGQWVQPRIPGNILEVATDDDQESGSASGPSRTAASAPVSAPRPSIAALREQALAHAQNSSTAISTSPPDSTSNASQASSQTQSADTSAPQTRSSAASSTSTTVPHLPAHQHPSHPHYNPQPPPGPPQGQSQGQGAQPQPAHAHHHHHHQHHLHHTGPQPHAYAHPHPLPPPHAPHGIANEVNTSRLFKLQFDSRRIICCSQQPIIVGWDFANGDRDIIEASQFFGLSIDLVDAVGENVVARANRRILATPY